MKDSMFEDINELVISVCDDDVIVILKKEESLCKRDIYWNIYRLIIGCLVFPSK